MKTRKYPFRVSYYKGFRYFKEWNQAAKFAFHNSGRIETLFIDSKNGEEYFAHQYMRNADDQRATI